MVGASGVQRQDVPHQHGTASPIRVRQSPAAAPTYMSVRWHLPFPVKLNLAAPPTASRPGYDPPPAAATGCAATTDSEATTRIDSDRLELAAAAGGPCFEVQGQGRSGVVRASAHRLGRASAHRLGWAGHGAAGAHGHCLWGARVRARVGRLGRARPGSAWAAPSMAPWARAGPDRAGPDRAGPDRAGPDRAGPVTPSGCVINRACCCWRAARPIYVRIVRWVFGRACVRFSGLDGCELSGRMALEILCAMLFLGVLALLQQPLSASLLMYAPPSSSDATTEGRQDQRGA
jgi:hypothetical protein